MTLDKKINISKQFFLPIIILILLITGCSNEKNDLKEQLEFAVANKDHYEIIILSKKILDIDNRDIDATVAYRDSIRVYKNLRYAAEALMKVSSTNYLESDRSRNLDDLDELIRYSIEYYNENALSDGSSQLPVTTDLTESTKNVFRTLHIDYSACNYGDDVKYEYQGQISNISSPSDCLKGRLSAHQLGYEMNDWIDNYKQSIKHLIEAKEYFEVAQKLDPRFRGVIELEDHLEDRAEIFAGSLHYIFLASVYPSKVENALGMFDGLYSLTNTYWDTYSSLSYSSYSVSDAYSSAKSKFDEIYGPMMLEALKKDSDNAMRIQRLYEDLDDEFDIKSLKSAIEMTESISTIIKYSAEAKGSLRDWYSLIEDAAGDYRDSVDDFVDEVDWNDFIESLIEIEGELSKILDPEVIEASEAYPELV